MIIIGVTGGIGSGKSEVCRLLSLKGAELFSADDVARRLMTEDESIRKRIEGLLGRDAYTPDGSLNKPFVSKAIFSSDETRSALEEIVHPAVYQRFHSAAREARTSGCKLFIREAALLPESSRLLTDFIVVVTAPEKERVARVRMRDDLTEAEIRSRINSQMSDTSYLENADFIIENRGSLEELESRVSSFLDWLEPEAMFLSGPTKRPVIGKGVPRKRKGFVDYLARRIFFGSGWRFEGSLPDQSRFVIIGAPHTSNWDFVLAMLTIYALRLDFRWIGKHTLFRRPFSTILKKMGGTPVDRSAAGGIVDQVVGLFETETAFVFGLAPEGTRKRVLHWKTGFHRIARRASVPIVPAYLDFGRRIIGFGPPMFAGGHPEADIGRLKLFYQQFEGKRPDLG